MTTRAVKDRHTLAEIDRQAEILSPGHIRRCTDEHGVLSPADTCDVRLALEVSHG